ncbi:uncharacterized protein LOC6735021 [Drosophila simulans]|uniref:GD25432 n=1 Tax=Drosophila simulans TaxID=7240 RepID=B4QBS7_DROSI|nr:uncharacterized protein LOC6735021 [Drosophila simulans]EDX07587.1 GD25432 [Drosophila simulans]KMY94713.1 uncharacterized protein Dsimw501_GD25432 [Drosophila simulans]
MSLNIWKSTRLLDRNCLRGKIQGLSPLLRTMDWPPNRDSVFRATWSYYASGCQERLTDIRRRIEQNARIVAPIKEPITKLPVDLKMSFNENQLPPGIDLDEHIYQELVSCFRNAKSTESKKKKETSAKRSKVQKYFDMGKFSTPEKWIAWKRQELQVGQMLQNSFDPYLRAEMHKKLQHLQKLTKLRPLVVLPNQEENINKHKVSLTKKRKSRQKSTNSLKAESESRKNSTQIADTYKTYKNPGKNSKIQHLRIGSIKSEHSKQSSRKSTTSTILAFHPSLESIASTRQSTRFFRPYVKRPVKSNHSSSDEDVLYAVDDLGESPLLKDITTTSVASEKHQKSKNLKLPMKIKKPKLIKQRKHAEKTKSKNPKIHKNSKHPKSLSYYSFKTDSESVSKNVSFSESKTSQSKQRILRKKLILRKSKSEGTIEEDEQPVDLRQSFASKSMSQFLSNYPTSRSIEYLAQIAKGPSSNNLVLNLKNKFNESVVSLYRGQMTNSDNGSEIQDIHRSFILSGDHHGWTFLGKKMAFVPPTSYSTYSRAKLKRRDPNEPAEKNVETDGPDKSPLNSIANVVGNKTSPRTTKEQEGTRMQSKTVSVDEMLASVEAKPLLISDLVSDFMLSYGSSMGFFETNPDLFKSNQYEANTTNVKEVPKKCPQKRKVKKVKDVKKKPSQHFKKTCSLCKCVRRKRSELQPYMLQMQKRRQRLELKSYYIQRISKCQEFLKHDPKETCTRDGLAICYETLNLCQQIVDQKLSKRS